MYKITIPHKQQGAPALKLETEKRNLARAAYLLAEENGLKATVVAEVKPREVKFKGTD